MGSKERARSSNNKSEKDEGGRAARDPPPPVAAAPSPPPPPPPEERGSSPSSDDRAARRAAKKLLEKRLASSIPTHDDDGMPYGKAQIRRMKRRLSPIPTEEEEREIREREKREREEEEELYHATNDSAVRLDDDDVDDDGGEEVVAKWNPNEKDDVMRDVGVADASSSDDNDDVDENDHEGGGERGSDAKADERARCDPPPAKRSKRNKPVPPDYVCMACRNKSPFSPSSSLDVDAVPASPHWIYDCPLKKTQRGCNKVAKKLRGLHDPPSRKVFVGGLPFDCDEGEVKRYFDDGLSSSSSSYGDGVVHVKLLKFEDSKRCKGQAFLTFDTDEGAAAAISTMNGSIWRVAEDAGTTTDGKKKKKKKKDGETGEGVGPKRELRLKVTRALNRFVTGMTKTKSGGGGRKSNESKE
ncbi:hypothetical protein ACHAW5_010157 [Stephanodiscus triporus]|uniref:RRM domain-containing protein n=1 Tax=Stephanodiscus triporus TaxID=2934178 RepID=A0ABD3NIV8_9STRA